ncbi:MAG: carboxypeptidase-like regulatory domain-containing protein, partial [Cyclobacteriaceae bacterium]
MIRKFYYLLFLLSPFMAMAQTGTITGKIIDKETNEPLIGATVLVKGLSMGSIADLDGSYTIKDVPAGDQTVTITFVGYADISKKVTVRSGETTDLGTSSLGADVIGLKEVEIFSSVVEDRKTPVAVSAISAE